MPRARSHYATGLRARANHLPVLPFATGGNGSWETSHAPLPSDRATAPLGDAAPRVGNAPTGPSVAAPGGLLRGSREHGTAFSLGRRDARRAGTGGFGLLATTPCRDGTLWSRHPVTVTTRSLFPEDPP